MLLLHLVRKPPARHTNVGHDDERDERSGWPFEDVHKSFSEGNGKAITLWSNADLSNRHIMAISGHRNEQSLKSYNARPSSAQLQRSSNVLSNALSATSVPSTSVQIHPQAPQAQILSQSAQSFYRNATFTNMFSGCSIGSVQVVVKPRREVDETRSIYNALLPLFWFQFTRRSSQFLLF